MLSKVLKWRFLGLLIWIALAMSSTATASRVQKDGDSEKREKAKAAYIEGKDHYRAGRFEQAMAAFKESYNISGEPNLLFNLAITAEELGDFERAIAFYELYLEELPEAKDTEDIKKRVDALKKRPSSDGEAQPPEKELNTREAVGTTPEEEVKTPPTGDTPFSSEKSKSMSKVEIENYYFPDEKNTKKPVFWPSLALSAGGLLVAGGTITGILAYKEYDSLKTSCAPNCASKNVSKAKDLAIATDVLIVVGAAGLATGAILWILGKRGKIKGARRGNQALSLVPVGRPGGAALMASGRF